jgi:NCS1 family nucleobase:cation symporter-1
MRYVPNKKQVRERLTSVKAWELPKQKSALAPPHVWTNEDMDPVKIENQTWTLWTWMAYWATDTINLGTWETASSILAVGLTWRDAIPIVCFFLMKFGRHELIGSRSWLARLVLLFLWF